MTYYDMKVNCIDQTYLTEFSDENDRSLLMIPGERKLVNDVTQKYDRDNTHTKNEPKERHNNVERIGGIRRNNNSSREML